MSLDIERNAPGDVGKEIPAVQEIIEAFIILPPMWRQPLFDVALRKWKRYEIKAWKASLVL